MSRIKELKNKDWNKINIVDLYQKIIASDKTKYVELLEKVMDNYLDNHYPFNEVIREIKRHVPDFEAEGLTYFEIILLHSVIVVGGGEKMVNFNKFIEYNERNLIEKNDVTTYKTFEEIENQVNITDIKLITKDLEKQVVTLLNNDEWIVVKPLTYESSKKYGSNTKWCTTMATEPSYFYRYFRNGILIYCMNKKTGYKVAAYKKKSERETTFWDQKDNRIDSFESELTGEVINILKKEFKECKKSNYELADPDAVKREMEFYHMSYRDNVPEAAQPRRGVPVNNAFDGEEEQELPNVPMEEPMAEREEGDVFTKQDLEMAMESLGEEMELEDGDMIGEEMSNDDILEMLTTEKSELKGNYVIDVDDDEVHEVNLEMEEVHVEERVRPLRIGEVDRQPFAVIKKSSITYVDTDDDLPQHDGRVEGIAGVPNDIGGVVGYQGVGAERVMANQIHEAMGENEGEWPVNHGINVRG